MRGLRVKYRKKTDKHNNKGKRDIVFNEGDWV